MGFAESRDQLQQARLTRQRAESELFIAKEKLAGIRRRQSQLGRQAGSAAIGGEVLALEKRASEVQGQVSNWSARQFDAVIAETDLSKDFQLFTDPRENLGHLDDRFPILLFPLRLETRFKQVTSGGRTVPQLWVRAFPDDIAVDGFEPTLSENEVRNGRAYLVSLWRAGGVERDERAAWRALVASHGSGRAWWISQHYRPLNLDDKPVLRGPGDTILVVASEQLPAPAERAEIARFWSELWLARGDSALSETARVRLRDRFGEARARVIQTDFIPANFTAKPPTGIDHSDLTVQSVFLHLPDSTALATRLQPWSQAPKTHILPERLVLLGYSGAESAIQAIGAPIPSSLALGPNPSAAEEQQIRIEDGDLVVDEEMRWLVDFDRAVASGMGFKLDLTLAQAERGFDRLFVLGVRLGTDHEMGAAALETLFEHHHHGRKGLAVLPQGTPTNNTEKTNAAFIRQEDADISFDRYFGGLLPEDPTDWDRKHDGRWLAEMLGIDPGKIADLPHYHHTDQCEARAMNTALWPATLGYFMQTLMSPSFSEATIEQTRRFFRDHVSGRGRIPALRVGRQPYGILPATPFARLAWIRHPNQPEAGPAHPLNLASAFHYRLHAILTRMNTDWSGLSERVSHLGQAGDPHQILLDILGLHPNSVAFYARTAQSFAQIHNTLGFNGLAAVLAELMAGAYIGSGMDLLARFSLIPEKVPEILKKFFFEKSDLLKGPLIDDVPLSESDPIRSYCEDGRNYLRWLIDAAGTSHDALRRQQGFIANQPPVALLYLMLQHALDLGYVDAGLRLHVASGVMTGLQMTAFRQEPEFIHIQQETDAGSRWQHLYRAEERITSRPGQLVGEFIPGILARSAETRLLQEQVAALNLLEMAPTARLERAFVEHLDTCAYRLDAWSYGLVNLQLARMRHLAPAEPGATPAGAAVRGIYLGAYGWLEDLRPEHKRLEPVALTGDLARIFDDPQHPLTQDDTNAGYIHAPSLNQAVTAAILRNGFLENATPANPGSLAVNLSSERVRLALSIIEGMQGGQSLAAMLGYRLERGLHDRQAVEVDGLIYDLRKAFPLAANRLASTRIEHVEHIGQIEARNVLDGLALIRQIESSGVASYPFATEGLPALTPAQTTAVDQEVARIRDINDAVADLALAESVHQAMQGNADRAAAVLDGFARGNLPPLPDVVRTPRSGVTLTHRVAVQFGPGPDPADAHLTTPRARAQPALNEWLRTLLPDLAALACRAAFEERGGTARDVPVSLGMLDLQPVDLVTRLNLESEQAMSWIDDHIAAFIRDRFPNLAPDSDIRIDYTDPIAGMLTLFEAAPYLESLRTLIGRSRALTAADVRLATEAAKADERRVTLDPRRIRLNVTELEGLGTALDGYLASLAPLVDGEDSATIIGRIDGLIDDLARLCQPIGLFGFPASGTGGFYQWRRARVLALTAILDETIARWREKLVAFDGIIAEYDALDPATETTPRFRLLQKAERKIATHITAPLPADPAAFRDRLAGAARTAFATQLEAIAAARTAPNLTVLYAAITALQPALAAFDLTELNIEGERNLALVFARDLLAGAANLRANLASRTETIGALMARHDATAVASERVDLLIAAGKALFGEDFSLIPEFTLSEQQAAEWHNAYGHRADLLTYQKDELGQDFPVDNWLYGVARVREKMAHLEKAVIHAESLAGASLPLDPIQLPFREADSWLALEFPSKTADGKNVTIDEDKLLYTAHYAAPGFAANRAQRGLLIDEWTEIVPARREDTGLTFHYDRPNSEPPQTLLLATPALFTGGWQWRDLVDCLHETLAMAKKRAVEPARVDTTDYARFLPATLSALTVYPITAALNLALNNQFYLAEAPDHE